MFHAYFQPIIWAHTHFQFIIHAQGQNCHGGLALALTLQLKRLSEFPLTYTIVNFHSSTLAIIDIHDVCSCSCQLNSVYTDSGAVGGLICLGMYVIFKSTIQSNPSQMQTILMFSIGCIRRDSVHIILINEYAINSNKMGSFCQAICLVMEKCIQLWIKLGYLSFLENGIC